MKNNTKENRKELEQITLRFIQDFFLLSQDLKEKEVITTAGAPLLERLRNMDIPENGRQPDEVIWEMTEQIYPFGCHSAHPRFLGFVPSGASYLSWLGDIMTSAYNRHAGSFANFPSGCIIEQNLLQWLARQAGFPRQAGGLFVSGGSMANLTALTVARDKILPEESWPLGTAYVSDQTHSSVAKGLHMIGIPESHIQKIPTDMTFRMDASALEQAIRSDLSKGLRPFTVIASAGTTNTGSVDPLPEIASICRRYGMWMHVDGAFGASVLLSRKHRHLLDGVQLADSLSWDAHKWLFQTYGCGMVFVKDKRDMVRSFHSHPEYLKDLDTEEESMNPWNLGPELTRPARSLKLWLTLQVMGSRQIGEAIDHGFDLAAYAQQELSKYPDVQLLSPAQMCVVNFRFHPFGLTEEETDRLNLEIAQKILSSGYAGIFTTELRGKKALRLCLLHPETTNEDVSSILRYLDDCRRELLPAETYMAAAGGI